MPISKIKIESPADFEDYATDLLSQMTELLTEDKRYCVHISEQTEVRS